MAQLLICRGQFFVLSDSVSVHVLTAEQTTAFYERTRLAEQCRNPEQATAEALRLSFGVRGALQALPAFTIEALLWYAEKYKGPLQDTVRGLAACILTGTPFGPSDAPPEGGQKARLQVTPNKPAGSGGATFAEMLAGVSS